MSTPIKTSRVECPTAFSYDSFRDALYTALRAAFRGVEFDISSMRGVGKTRYFGTPVVEDIDRFVQDYMHAVVEDPEVINSYKGLQELKDANEKLIKRELYVKDAEKNLEERRQALKEMKEDWRAARDSEMEKHRATIKKEREELADAVRDFENEKATWESTRDAEREIMEIEVTTKVNKNYHDAITAFNTAEARRASLEQRINDLNADVQTLQGINDKYVDMLAANFERFEKIALKGIEVPPVTATAKVQNSNDSTSCACE